MIILFEAFAGYGAFSIALKRAGIPFKTVGISEIDKYAITAYKALHGDIKNYGDIKKIDEKMLPDFNFFCYSFPCTDISVSGKQKGLYGTRSGLLWECERIIEHKKPKILFMENVKNLVGKTFRPDFDKWCSKLESIGYKNHWEIINAKEHGIPQNRERVFMVSILKDDSQFIFPNTEDLKIFLKDITECHVDEKYYLKPDKYKNLIVDLNNDKWGKNPSGNKFLLGAAQRGRENGQQIELNGGQHSNALTTVQKDSLVAEIIQLGNYREGSGNFKNPQTGRVYSINGISPTLNTMQGGDRQPKIFIDLKIRKLTPIECFRLMDVSDDEFNLIKKALMDEHYGGKDRCSSQLYKLAGNSIVIKPLEKVLKNIPI